MKAFVLILIVLVSAVAADAEVMQIFPQKIGAAVVVGTPATLDSDALAASKSPVDKSYARRGADIVYRAAYKLDGKSISIDVCDMTNSTNAFGLYASDSLGEQLKIGQGACYRAGVLRGWQDRYFVKVTLPAQSPALKQFATDYAKMLLGQVQTEGRLPQLVAMLGGAGINADNIRLGHNAEDVNKVFPVATAALLKLGEGAEVAAAECKLSGAAVKVLAAKYEQFSDLQAAADGFVKKIAGKKDGLGKAQSFVGASSGSFSGAKIVWVDFDPILVLCTNAKTAADCQMVLDRLAKAAK